MQIQNPIIVSEQGDYQIDKFAFVLHCSDKLGILEDGNGAVCDVIACTSPAMYGFPNSKPSLCEHHKFPGMIAPKSCVDCPKLHLKLSVSGKRVGRWKVAAWRAQKKYSWFSQLYHFHKPFIDISLCTMTPAGKPLFFV